MTVSKGIKIILGIATGFYAVAPLLSVGFYFLWMLSMFPVFASMEHGRAAEFPGIQFFLGFFVFFCAIMLFNLLHLILIPVYTALIIKNKAGLEILRIIIAVGFFFLPFIAMPAYYLIYIFPTSTPEWALEPKRIPPDDAPATTN